MDDELIKLKNKSKILEDTIKSLYQVWNDSVSKRMRIRYLKSIEDEGEKSEIILQNQTLELDRINQLSQKMQEEINQIEKTSVEIEKSLNDVEIQIDIIQQKSAIIKNYILAAVDNKKVSENNLIQAKALVKG